MNEENNAGIFIFFHQIFIYIFINPICFSRNKTGDGNEWSRIGSMTTRRNKISQIFILVPKVFDYVTLSKVHSNLLIGFLLVKFFKLLCFLEIVQQKKIVQQKS